eukprot:CAMPEP_0116875540 /NCGR_PEP_ID=MMETSP0463-20121206/7537_1 /TAXON_ID=181622 /ORGANISM="Strombidinopsis sp, Strain SopsisLIS2011" /LENGTH=61 /DNA_ID=CAMNT_0004521357 /DNA_START=218 /DNA_END=403 /DNA_ORIENTATION=+
MIRLEDSPMIEARYDHLMPPDFRMIVNARDIKYTGQLDVNNLSSWLLKKIGLPHNKKDTMK